jgi:CRP-like cAMP-binding protein
MADWKQARDAGMKRARSLPAPDKVFERLLPFGILRRVRGHTVLFRQGESAKELLLVLEGEIALTPDASEPTLCRVAGPGSVLGLPATLSDNPYGFTAVAVESCKIAIVSRKRSLEALREDTETAMYMVQMLAQEISEMQNVGLQFRLAQLNELTIP